MKYVGSKNKLAKDLAPIIQSYITDDTIGYLEPFVGGANMIDKIQHHNKIGCDIHKQLIALLNKAKSDVDAIPDTVTKEQYINVRNNINNFEDWYVGLVGFCASYNSKYFGGYANNVITKIGTVRNYTDESIRNLKKQAPSLRDIKFKCCSFLDLPKDKIKGYVIYCDIPYRGTTKYKTEQFPYEEFYKWANEMSIHNTVLISEYNMPKIYKCIWSKDLNTSMNHDRTSGDESNKRVEKLFMYDAESGYIE